MERKAVSGVMLILLLMGMLTLAFNIHPVKTWAGTVYIRADGSIDPPDAPIQRDGDIYTFTDNIYGSVIIQKDSIVVDGEGYTVEGDGAMPYGIYLNGRFNVTLKDMKITKFFVGIRFDYTNCSVVFNIDSSNNDAGIYLQYSSNNVLFNCTTCYNRHGIALTSSPNNNISKNVALYNDCDGIVLTSSDNNTVRSNRASSNKEAGIMVFGSKNNIIYNNELVYNKYGIYTDYSVNDTILSNMIYGKKAPGEAGIKLYRSSKSNISNNEVSGCTFGILLNKSRSNVISRNHLVRNNIDLVDSHSNLVLDNEILKGGICVGLNSGSDNNVITNNTINGWYDNDPQYGEVGIFISGVNNIASFNYIWDCHFGIAVSSLMSYSQNNTILNNKISPSIADGSAGIAIEGADCNYIFSNTVWGGDYAIRLILIFEGGVCLKSENNIISNNTVSGGSNGVYGITDNSTIFNNNIRCCSNGIALSESYNNTILQNNLNENSVGISLEYSSNNAISRNNITANDVGIWLYFSSNNSIFHNNFINNTEQAYSSASINSWDDGYPSGGNYWSDYNGTDLYSGVYQNETGSDGIGDTPYVIDENNQDNYPLMSPWVGVHDVAITNITFSPQQPKTNETIHIYVMIENKGGFTETFTVCVNYTRIFDPQIGNQTVTLAPGESITLNFTWTSNIAGRYEIKAYISEIYGDINPNDNIKTANLYVSPHSSSNGGGGKGRWRICLY